MNYNEYMYGFIVLIVFLVSAINLYFDSIGYDAYEVKEKTAGVLWIIGILGYIGIKIYHFIKERK